MAGTANGAVRTGLPEDPGQQKFAGPISETVTLGPDPTAADRPPFGVAPGAEAVPALVLDLYVPRKAGRYPVVEFAHHFGGTKADYENWGKLLASRGFIVILADNRGQADIGPDVQGMSIGKDTDPPGGNVQVVDLLRILNWSIAESRTNTTSPLYGKVDPDRLGLVGNSLGGYNATLATYLSDQHQSDPITGARWPAIAALVALDPSGVDASKNAPGFDDSFVYRNVTTPTAVIASEEDEFTKPIGLCDEGYDHTFCYLGANQEFVSLPRSTPKLGLKVICSHHLWAEDPNDDDGTLFGADAQFNDPALKARCASHTGGQPLPGQSFAPSPDPAAVRIWKRYAMAWLEYWLERDCTVSPFLGGSAFHVDQSSRVITTLPADRLPSQKYFTANPQNIVNRPLPGCS